MSLWFQLCRWSNHEKIGHGCMHFLRRKSGHMDVEEVVHHILFKFWRWLSIYCLHCSRVRWCSFICRVLGVCLPQAPKIICDGLFFIFLASNPISKLGSKHVEVDYHFYQEIITKGALILEFVRTKNHYVDLFTKALLSDRFLDLCRKIKVHTNSKINSLVSI